MAPWGFLETHFPAFLDQISQMALVAKLSMQTAPAAPSMLPANCFRRCGGDFLISVVYLMVAADRDARIKYACKTGHLSTRGPRASIPERWGYPRIEGPKASKPERQDTSP